MMPALQVAFMTGQSDPDRCALSPSQQAFLDALAVPEAAKIRCNFPYDAQSAPYRDVSLVKASWHNARHFVASRAPAFAERHRDAVVRVIDRAESTVLLAGSCGLELLGNLDLPPAALQRLSVFAYGAVARRRPACRAVMSVVGRRDWIARPMPGRTDLIVPCHHMNYLETPEVLAACQAFLSAVARRADPAA